MNTQPQLSEDLVDSSDDVLKEPLVSLSTEQDKLDGASFSRDVDEYTAMVSSEDQKMSIGSGAVSGLDTLMSQVGYYSKWATIEVGYYPRWATIEVGYYQGGLLCQVGCYPRWVTMPGGLLSQVGYYPRWAAIPGGLLCQMGYYARWATIPGGLLSQVGYY